MTGFAKGRSPATRPPRGYAGATPPLKTSPTFFVCMTPDSDRVRPGGEGLLDERVLAALRQFDGRIAFSGLRRAVHAHPESLTRTLRRLEREGRVERIEGAYRVPRQGEKRAPVDPVAPRLIAEVELPLGISEEEVVARLAGRWFGSLRWVGVIGRSPERRLAWTRRDGHGVVLLEIRHRELRVSLAGGGSSGPQGTEDAAYELLYHAVEAIRSSDGGMDRSSVRTFVAPVTSVPLEN